MKCIKCGNNLGENDMFCPVCGTPIQKSQGNSTNVQNQEAYNYQRNMNNQHPNMQNYNQQGYNDNMKKRSNSANTIVIIIVCILILLLVGFGIPLMMIMYGEASKTIEDSSYGTNNLSTTNSSTITTTSNQKESSSYKVNFLNFDFYIPDDIKYKFDSTNSAMIIGDAADSWIAQIQINVASFSELKSKTSIMRQSMLNYLSSYDLTISEAKIEKIDGVEFILFEAEAAGERILVGYAELNPSNVMTIETANENNDYDRESLKYVAQMVKSAQYNEGTKNIEFQGINSDEISDALIKATEDISNE